MKENDGGPAFPRTDACSMAEQGMSLRDYFAAKAMQGMVSAISEISNGAGIITNRPSDISQIAYVYADAMLAERDK